MIHDTHGNTLAVSALETFAACPNPLSQYALTSMQNLMELDYGWSSLDEPFIAKVVQILTSPTSLINVCRPATAILKKLVEADPSSAPGAAATASKSPSALTQDSVYQFGFQVVHNQMRKERGLLETVVNRLGSAETVMVQHGYVI